VASTDNRQLSQKRDADRHLRAPRCAVKTAETYRRQFGLDDREIAAPKTPSEASKRLWRDVSRVLGSCTPAYLGDDALRCERYLLHAVWSWLSNRARSEDTQASYLAAFRWWVAVSGRRSLDRQLDTRPYHVGQWLEAVDAVSRSPRSVNLRASVLRSWFTWLFDQELLGRTPFRPASTCGASTTPAW
jgi:hypothetical protein